MTWCVTIMLLLRYPQLSALNVDQNSPTCFLISSGRKNVFPFVVPGWFLGPHLFHNLLNVNTIQKPKRHYVTNHSEKSRQSSFGGMIFLKKRERKKNVFVVVVKRRRRKCSKGPNGDARLITLCPCGCCGLPQQLPKREHLSIPRTNERGRKWYKSASRYVRWRAMARESQSQGTA